jgi:signal transduction histidine kinase
MSVRTRITLLATVVVALVLVLASFGLVTQQRRVLTASLDESLQQRASELEHLSAEAVVETPIQGLGDDDAAAQLVIGGELMASSRNLVGEPLVVPPPTEAGRTVRTVHGLPHEDGPFRLLTSSGGGDVLVVAAPLDDIDDSTSTLIRLLVIGIPMVVAALGLALWWLVGRTLRPVEAIRAEVARIGAHDLHRRVPAPAADDEVGRLARTMNDMLERVEDATRRQQRFLADASHELRSPLTRMRTELEVDLAHPADADLRRTHESVLEETIGLQRLADDLLRVARVDAGAIDGGREPVDLDDVVLRVARRLRADDRVRVDLSAVGPARVVGDADQLARLVSNLADNALRHAASLVSFSLSVAHDEAVLTVADDGPGVPPTHRDLIFERFARVDEARRAADGGTGLGLAIARDIAEHHGGTLVLDAGAPATRFVLTLPVDAAD